jgi:fructose-1-phosphate kinase PfkB-like protein
MSAKDAVRARELAKRPVRVPVETPKKPKTSKRAEPVETDIERVGWRLSVDEVEALEVPSGDD